MYGNMGWSKSSKFSTRLLVAAVVCPFAPNIYWPSLPGRAGGADDCYYYQQSRGGVAALWG